MDNNTVEKLCNQLARNRLLEPEEIRNMYRRWRTEAGPAVNDNGKFNKWLVSNKFVTEFQLGLVERGFGEMLFISEYKLIDRIGHGRMAGVYKAIHSSGQVAAIKVLPPSKSKHPQLLARFRREARLAERLDHDNVVRTFHCGQTQTGLPYIVMEFLDGETLAEILERRQRLPVGEAIDVATQILEGLQHLHEEGIVHRDLKPANMMLVPAPASGKLDSTQDATLKILDIGLSRALFDEGSPGDPLDLTADGALLGTPNYLAPEQARSAHTADIRADIYSVGCILYEMLSGKTPFEEPNLARQLIRHATELARPIKELNAAVPDGLNHIVMTMLAKDPSMRYAVPSQAAKALRDLAPPPPRPLQQRPSESFLEWLKTQPKVEDDGLAPPPPAANPEPAGPPKLPPNAPPPPTPPVSPGAMPAPTGANPPTAPIVATNPPSPLPTPGAVKPLPPGPGVLSPSPVPTSLEVSPTAGVPTALWVGSSPEKIIAPTVLRKPQVPFMQRRFLFDLITGRDLVATGIGASVLILLQILVRGVFRWF